MSTQEGFLGRWSRLKRTQPPAPLPAAVAAPAEPVIPPDAAEVPLEDIALWIRRGAPQIWAQAALRRLWTSDPTISTFIGPADYAWDWNAPGGVPGWGPMTALDDIGKLLARAVGEPLAPDPAAAPEPEAPSGPDAPQTAESVVPPRVQAAPVVAVAVEAQPPATAHRRRGGGAAPV